MKKTISIALVLMIALFSLTACSAESKTYKDAVSAYDAGDYQKAVELLDTIPDYDDSKDIRKQATARIDFNSAVESVKAKNTELDATITLAQALLGENKTPLEPTTLTDLQVSISTAKEAKRDIPDMPTETELIIAETETLNVPLDYSEFISSLNNSKTALENSIKQLEQVTNPTGDFVILRLKEVSGIVDIQGVTEDNDPNGKLNKAGGYTSQTYFSSELINQADVYGDNLIDKGTSAGGSIEVYATIEDAEKRNTYLAGFDGGIFSTGSHEVIGTVIIRTSDELTASQQKDLSARIKEKLIELK